MAGGLREYTAYLCPSNPFQEVKLDEFLANQYPPELRKSAVISIDPCAFFATWLACRFGTPRRDFGHFLLFLCIRRPDGIEDSAWPSLSVAR